MAEPEDDRSQQYEEAVDKSSKPKEPDAPKAIVLKVPYVTLQNGESLSSIAQDLYGRQDVSLVDFLASNSGIDDKDAPIPVGQRIILHDMGGMKDQWPDNPRVRAMMRLGSPESSEATRARNSLGQAHVPGGLTLLEALNSPDVDPRLREFAGVLSNWAMSRGPDAKPTPEEGELLAGIAEAIKQGRIEDAEGIFMALRGSE